jgi:hypothetical protein
MNRSTSTANSGEAKLQRAINQLDNAERLIASLPRQFERDKCRELANIIYQLRKRIETELVPKE